MAYRSNGDYYYIEIHPEYLFIFVIHTKGRIDSVGKQGILAPPEASHEGQHRTVRSKLEERLLHQYRRYRRASKQPIGVPNETQQLSKFQVNLTGGS